MRDVNDTDSGSNVIPIEITISRDHGAILNKVSSLVSSYNNVLSTLKTQTEYNEATKRMGILSDDIAVGLIKSQMKLPFQGVVDGFSSVDPYTQASDLGLAFDGRGNLKLDSAIFNTALEDNFSAVINLLGAMAKGNTDSSTVEFNSASERYTQAGVYDFEVIVASGAITSGKIKLQSETTFRTMTIENNLVIGDSTFDSIGTTALFPENGLHLQVDVSSDGTYTGLVRVKQGFAGELEDLLDDIADTGGRLDVSREVVDDRVNRLGVLIQQEEARLEIKEQHLVAKFARLERALQDMQQQLSAVNMITAVTFG